MAFSLVTAPASEPVTLAEAKVQLRLPADQTDEDALVMTLVQAARERAETATRRQLLTATWDVVFDAFPATDWLDIPKPPLQSVSFLKYLDTAGTLQTWSSSLYSVEAPAGPRCARGRVILPFAQIWPIALSQRAAVTMRIICGYGDKGAMVPARLRQAMLMDLSTLYAYRENIIAEEGTVVLLEVPDGSKSIYSQYRSYAKQDLDRPFSGRYLSYSQPW